MHNKNQTKKEGKKDNTWCLQSTPFLNFGCKQIYVNGFTCLWTALISFLIENTKDLSWFLLGSYTPVSLLFNTDQPSHQSHPPTLMLVTPLSILYCGHLSYHEPCAFHSFSICDYRNLNKCNFLLPLPANWIQFGHAINISQPLLQVLYFNKLFEHWDFDWSNPPLVEASSRSLPCTPNKSRGDPKSMGDPHQHLFVLEVQDQKIPTTTKHGPSQRSPLGIKIKRQNFSKKMLAA